MQHQWVQLFYYLDLMKEAAEVSFFVGKFVRGLIYLSSF